LRNSEGISTIPMLIALSVVACVCFLYYLALSLDIFLYRLQNIVDNTAISAATQLDGTASGQKSACILAKQVLQLSSDSSKLTIRCESLSSSIPIPILSALSKAANQAQPQFIKLTLSSSLPRFFSREAVAMNQPCTPPLPHCFHSHWIQLVQ
jgi:hypothetical protein